MKSGSVWCRLSIHWHISRMPDLAHNARCRLLLLHVLLSRINFTSLPGDFASTLLAPAQHSRTFLLLPHILLFDHSLSGL